MCNFRGMLLQGRRIPACPLQPSDWVECVYNDESSGTRWLKAIPSRQKNTNIEGAWVLGLNADTQTVGWERKEILSYIIRNYFSLSAHHRSTISILWWLRAYILDLDCLGINPGSATCQVCDFGELFNVPQASEVWHEYIAPKVILMIKWPVILKVLRAGLGVQQA